jgi:uncharacterized protein YecT (DUF1311 family)
MQIGKSGLKVMLASALVVLVCLLALADETHRASGNSHVVLAAQQGKSANRSGNADDDHPIDKWLARAIEKDSTTAGMIRATDTAQQKWDQEMNRVYRKLMKRLNPEQRAALLKAQKAWIQYRDADLDAIGKIYIIPQGGTMYSVLAASEAMNRTKQRALELQDYEQVVEDHTGAN